MELGTGVIIFLLVAIAVAEDVTVITELGNITGTAEELTFNGKPFTITKFLGIPYAEPPTGTRRFHKPIKKRRLNGHFIANKIAPVCIQNYDHVRLLGIDPSTLQQAEDCLYLNIFVPGNGPIDKSQKYAVMIWIYGGSFQMGDQNTYDAKAFVGVNNVILVTFNYRVSLLGFLSTGEDNRSGNYGLWDQHEAIEWVHNHIENFGGDVMKVTIFGESAGGESVVYQALYDGNEDFFQRVIAQSGSANGPLAYDRNPSELYESYANKTGCLKEEQMETINCLRNLTVDEIIDSVKYSDMFLPVKDGDFVKVHPVDIFRNTSNEAWNILSRFGKFDLIFGVTSSEGGMSLGEVDTLTNASNNSIPTGYRRDTFESNIVSYGLKKAKLKDSQAIRAAFIHQYSDWTDPDNEPLILQVTVDLLSDIEFNAGIVKSAMAHADTGETGHLYFYVCIGESPSICPFLKNNGDEAPKGPSRHYFSGMDRYEDFLLLKIHLITNRLHLPVTA